MVAFVALGSNLGDRAAFLARAREAMASLPGTRLVAASRVEETAPIGDVPQGPYLNQMVALLTRLAPHALLDELLRIEHDAGRVRAERWGPRTLDVDLLVVEGETVAEPDLQVPHPRLHERLFVLVPLADVAPDLVPAASRDAGAAGDPSVRPTGLHLRVPA